ncbi:MAG: hypothetical protein OXC37_00990, partial [Bdellovibrionaceae bacterium]|nr:hypothetical protein [Pseudobdellovibrionaceae bacterium]
ILILITIFLSQSSFSLAEDKSSNKVSLYLKCSDYREIPLGEYLLPSCQDKDLEEVETERIALNTDLLEIENYLIDWRYIHNVKLEEIQSIAEKMNCDKLLLKEDGFDCLGAIRYTITTKNNRKRDKPCSLPLGMSLRGRKVYNQNATICGPPKVVWNDEEKRVDLELNRNGFIKKNIDKFAIIISDRYDHNRLLDKLNTYNYDLLPPILAKDNGGYYSDLRWFDMDIAQCSFKVSLRMEELYEDKDLLTFQNTALVKESENYTIRGIFNETLFSFKEHNIKNCFPEEIFNNELNLAF